MFDLSQAHVCTPLDSYSSYSDSRNPMSESEKNNQVCHLSPAMSRRMAAEVGVPYLSSQGQTPSTLAT